MAPFDMRHYELLNQTKMIHTQLSRLTYLSVVFAMLKITYTVLVQRANTIVTIF